ncbi:putative transposase/invertase (TIGR01784 family) [Anaerobacterium chartisolvens]|uniref:Putative transposase/invertase (TIGR01784 family) n=1 Tax=Anaerobacterium chartisolvens TaxID=1297424 RepID=A0A369BBQ9_9FIRM|nr:Rpn family recombination-promoting nuclease/putative transposase [Anaerobacterium chartisolvens]RCX18785.1 putative transposase/invertase (TIGR01784 family) [Anaerobacterium chartisolvens]
MSKHTKAAQDSDFIMLPVVDFVFKLLFGDIKHKERLISLLSAILRLPEKEFEGIEIINTELPRMFEEDKKGILDIRARFSGGKQVDIEIQVLPSVFMAERTLYYLGKMYTTQVKEGETFHALKKCIAINIVDYEFLPVRKMHTVYHLNEDETGHRLTDAVEVHFCELKKVREGTGITDMNDPSIDWMRFIGARTKGEMEIMAETNETIRDAFNYLQVISNDEQKRLEYESRQLWLMDQRTREKVARDEGMKEGIDKGIEKGIEKGALQAKTGIVKNLRSMGMKACDIARVTGLTQEEVENIK